MRRMPCRIGCAAFAIASEAGLGHLRRNGKRSRHQPSLGSHHDAGDGWRAHRPHCESCPLRMAILSLSPTFAAVNSYFIPGAEPIPAIETRFPVSGMKAYACIPSCLSSESYDSSTRNTARLHLLRCSECRRAVNMQENLGSYLAAWDRLGQGRPSGSDRIRRPVSSVPQTGERRGLRRFGAATISSR
jgi:hypothetical protein